ncbi:MAG TPA: gliding motility-associated C-terminal domain-containing protein, partial [Flavobacteriales bacterium]|nr:gliding motility-associated C-terminal domain-containing protein [Flavobacteriales bacterium]
VGTGTYFVTVTNDAGCSGVSQQFIVVVGSDPQASFSTDPLSPQGIGATVDFTDLSQGNGSPLVDWNWSFGLAGETSTSQSPSFTYDTPGDYLVSLTVTAADGCTSTSAITFVILPEAIIIPNVFTPNGDGKNEYFVIENGQFYENTLQVFNRWGQQVYETKNYRNAWRATDLPDGTYYYVFTTIRDGKEYTGHVTILR